MLDKIGRGTCTVKTVSNWWTLSSSARGKSVTNDDTAYGIIRVESIVTKSMSKICNFFAFDCG